MDERLEFKNHPRDIISFAVRPWGEYGWQVWKKRGVSARGMLVETYRGDGAKEAAIADAKRRVGLVG